MRKHLTVLLLSTGAAALALSLSVPTAMAGSIKATTWTVSPGGAVTGSGSVQVKDTKTGAIGRCASLVYNATLKSGKGLPGAGIGSIRQVVHRSCTLGTISFTVTAEGVPYKLNATSYTSGVTRGTVTGVDLVVTSSACNATLDGTAAGADNGKIAFSYTNSTGVFKLLPSRGNMHTWAVSGCFGLVNNGDPMAFSGSLKLSPKQTITSP